MDALAQKIIEAHGGLDQWRKFSTVSADLVQGGALWGLKGQSGKLDVTNVTVGLEKEWAAHSPFGSDGRSTHFTPSSVEILDKSGRILEKLNDPRPSFAGHTLTTPWTDTQLAYFAGIAMWTYLNVPFVLAAAGVESERIEDWVEDGETWQRLKVRFPDRLPTHSPHQTLYVDRSGLLKRHDYDVEIAGNTAGAHFIHDYVEVQKIKFPTKRRIFPRQPDNKAMAEPLVVAIDLSNIKLS